VWKPAWCPQLFEITNKVAGPNGDPATVEYGRYHLVERDGQHMAKTTMSFSGNLYEEFELHMYPFDTQPLGVHFQSTTLGPEDAQYVRTEANKVSLQVDSPAC
jgi:hypothetical protein